MPEVALSAGTIEYEDTGGDGPVIVLIHGVAMSSTLWREVIARLRDDYRCIAPTLPLGGHRTPMKPDADLTLEGQARLVGEFLEKLDLENVTLTFNDWGGPQVTIALGCGERIGRLVVTSCEAFDNYPPGLPGRMLVMAAKIPGGLHQAFLALSIRPLRRLPLTWGWMSKRPVPHEVMDGWFRPLREQKGVRRDLRKYATSVPPKAKLLEYQDALRLFARPALVVWAAEDKVMPPEHGRRIAEMLPSGRLIEVPGSFTLIPIDAPEALSRHIREFLAEPAGRPGGEGVSQR